MQSLPHKLLCEGWNQFHSYPQTLHWSTYILITLRHLWHFAGVMQFYLIDYFGIVDDIVQYFIYFCSRSQLHKRGDVNQTEHPSLSISWPVISRFSFYCIEKKLVINLSTSYSKFQEDTKYPKYIGVFLSYFLTYASFIFKKRWYTQPIYQKEIF